MKKPRPKIKQLKSKTVTGERRRMAFYLVALLSGLAVNSLLSFYAWAQADYRDPFASLLPRKAQEPVDPSQVSLNPDKTKELELPEMVVKGILWDSEKPMAIIDGEVYGLGDTIVNIGASVYKIEKNNVFIIYKGRTFIINIKKEDNQ